MIFNMDGVKKYELMEKFTKENGLKAKQMEKEHIKCQMELFMKVK